MDPFWKMPLHQAFPKHCRASKVSVKFEILEAVLAEQDQRPYTLAVLHEDVGILQGLRSLASLVGE